MFKLADPTIIIYQTPDGQISREFRLPVSLKEKPICEIIGQFAYFTTVDTRFVFSLTGRFVFASSLDLMIPVAHVNEGSKGST